MPLQTCTKAIFCSSCKRLVRVAKVGVGLQGSVYYKFPVQYIAFLRLVLDP